MIDNDKNKVTYDDVIKWIEEAYFDDDELDYENPYKPLDFNDEDNED